MNFIVGSLLYHSSEVVAFWIFVSLLEDFEMRDLYLPGIPGLFKHCQILNILLLIHCRDIFAHFVKIN